MVHVAVGHEDRPGLRPVQGGQDPSGLGGSVHYQALAGFAASHEVAVCAIRTKHEPFNEDVFRRSCQKRHDRDSIFQESLVQG
jgi:hypothetical protein